MTDFDDLFLSKQPINIDMLLKDSNLPVRFINILKSEVFYDVDSYYKRVCELYNEYTSSFLFPNKLMAFYPQVRQSVASSDLVCNLSGAKIKKGSVYYTYHPFIEDIKNGRVYTIRKMIKAELGFIDYFPRNLASYEEWYYKVKNAYYSTNNKDEIDFYLLSSECGEDCLEPYLLGKRKGRKKEIV